MMRANSQTWCQNFAFGSITLRDISVLWVYTDSSQLLSFIIPPFSPFDISCPPFLYLFCVLLSHLIPPALFSSFTPFFFLPFVHLISLLQCFLLLIRVTALVHWNCLFTAWPLGLPAVCVKRGRGTQRQWERDGKCGVEKKKSLLHKLFLIGRRESQSEKNR